MVRAPFAIVFTWYITCERSEEEISHLQEVTHPQIFGMVLQEGCVMHPCHVRNTSAFPVHFGEWIYYCMAEMYVLLAKRKWYGRPAPSRSSQTRSSYLEYEERASRQRSRPQ